MPFRLASVGGRAALVDGDHYHDLEALSGGTAAADPMAALADPAGLSRLAEGLGDADPTGALADVELGPPVPRPRNCYGVGLNYAQHAAESGAALPADPLVFTKFPSCIVGPTSEVRLRSDGVDYEGELVVVIGEPGHDIEPGRAWDHVVGLTVGQDISDRPTQFMTPPTHFDLGKSFDTFGPIGPWVVSTDSFEDPTDLRLRTWVNDELRQDDRTSNLIFDVAHLVSFLSHITSLQTGDIIFTGTPHGVDMSQDELLADGDVITTTIEGIGTMTNRCVRVGDWR